LIVARGFGPEARAALAANHDRLGMKLLGLMPADVSMRAVGVLEDLALATGATLVNEDLGISLARLRPAMLGRARQLHYSDGRVILADPAGDTEAVGCRQRALISEAARQRYLALDRDHLHRRAARLAGAWAEVRVGESPGGSAAKRVTRAKAAISAIRSAVADGVVPGGGVALARVAHLLIHSSRGTMDDDRLARRCVAAGCNSVLHWIATNAGSDGRHAVALAAGPAQDAVAYDASRRCAVPLREWSVADPLSTTQSILRRAVSTAATLLRVETLVCC
jgi:chaperonin GroEL (HSP60 family)